jgi:hypothetical protein
MSAVFYGNEVFLILSLAIIYGPTVICWTSYYFFEGCSCYFTKALAFGVVSLKLGLTFNFKLKL